MKRLFVVMCRLLLGIALAACASGEPDAGIPGIAITPVRGTPGAMARLLTGDETLLDIARDDRRCASLVTAIQLTELAETLGNTGSYTIFAPTDAAFAALPEGVFARLQQNPHLLAEILSYHIVHGYFLARDLEHYNALTSLHGAEIRLDRDGATVILNDNVRIVDTDMEAANGVMHMIDAVLLPPEVELPLATALMARST